MARLSSSNTAIGCSALNRGGPLPRFRGQVRGCMTIPHPSAAFAAVAGLGARREQFSAQHTRARHRHWHQPDPPSARHPSQTGHRSLNCAAPSPSARIYNRHAGTWSRHPRPLSPISAKRRHRPSSVRRNIPSQGIRPLNRTGAAPTRGALRSSHQQRNETPVRRNPASPFRYSALHKRSRTPWRW